MQDFDGRLTRRKYNIKNEKCKSEDRGASFSSSILHLLFTSIKVRPPSGFVSDGLTSQHRPLSNPQADVLTVEAHTHPVVRLNVFYA
jgi:hypothetical protein